MNTSTWGTQALNYNPTAKAILKDMQSLENPLVYLKKLCCFADTRHPQLDVVPRLDGLNIPHLSLRRASHKYGYIREYVPSKYSRGTIILFWSMHLLFLAVLCFLYFLIILVFQVIASFQLLYLLFLASLKFLPPCSILSTTKDFYFYFT